MTKEEVLRKLNELVAAGKSKVELEKDLGMSTNSLASILSGKRVLPDKVLPRIIEALGNPPYAYKVGVPYFYENGLFREGSEGYGNDDGESDFPTDAPSIGAIKTIYTDLKDSHLANPKYWENRIKEQNELGKYLTDNVFNSSAYKEGSDYRYQDGRFAVIEEKVNSDLPKGVTEIKDVVGYAIDIDKCINYKEFQESHPAKYIRLTNLKEGGLYRFENGRFTEFSPLTDMNEDFSKQFRKKYGDELPDDAFAKENLDERLPLEVWGEKEVKPLLDKPKGKVKVTDDKVYDNAGGPILRDTHKATDGGKVKVVNLNKEKEGSNYTVDTMPEKVKGETGIDFSIRLAEWKEQHKSKLK